MSKLKITLLGLILFTFGLFFGCQNETTAPEITPMANSSLSKIILPENAVIESATLKLYFTAINNQVLTVHNVLYDWPESVTWNEFYNNNPAPQYGPTVVSFTADTYGWDSYKSVDITSLVQAWMANPESNFGLLIDQEIVVAGRNVFNSKEIPSGNLPKLEILYKINGVLQPLLTTYPYADTYIYEIEPDISHSAKYSLYTGWLNVPPSDMEKQTLIKFELESSPQDDGCTLTPGYWKTHSSYGPAPYDETWTLIGEDSPFFLSGKSYYQVLHTSPAGNAYYNLSFHYIAAQLNFLNGASIPDGVQNAFNAATDLFNTYTPSQIAALRGNNPLRAQFINLAGILADYNEGDIGPGHCDDIEPL